MSEWIELEKQKPTAIGLYWVYYNHWRDGMTVGCIELQPIEVEPTSPKHQVDAALMYLQ